MQTHHPFRFVAPVGFSSPAQWTEDVRKAEALGYSVVGVGDHPAFGGPGPFSALTLAATATTKLRLTSHVLANDFRNPVMLAQEVATLDMISEGRYEPGLGTGWLRDDYSALGIPFDRPGTRVDRFEEAVTLFKRLFNEESVTFSGKHYSVQNAQINPKRTQPPRLFIGAGGKRILSLAGREADIIGFDTVSTAPGPKNFATSTSDTLMEQIGWVREAAGPRFDSLELQILVYTVAITEHRHQAAEQISELLASVPSSWMVNNQLSPEEVLESPRFLVGTVDEIVEQLQARRERYGISYITFLHFPGFADIDTFSPVVARLAGT